MTRDGPSWGPIKEVCAVPKIERLESKIAEAKAHLAQLKARHQRLEQATRAEAIA